MFNPSSDLMVQVAKAHRAPQIQAAEQSWIAARFRPVKVPFGRRWRTRRPASAPVAAEPARTVA